MSHHHHGFVATLTERLDDVLGQSAVPEIQAVQGLVQNQQLGVFHKGPCQQHQSLLTTRQLQKLSLSQMSDAKDVKPPTAFLVVLFVGDSIQSDGVHQTTGYDADGRQVALVGPMHLR